MKNVSVFVFSGGIEKRSCLNNSVLVVTTEYVSPFKASPCDCESVPRSQDEESALKITTKCEMV